MFKRNKDSPLDQMQILYQQFVNANLTNLSYCQQGALKEAVSGFRSLHHQADSQLEVWNKDCHTPKSKWTAEEILLLDELNKLRAEIEDNWQMVEHDYEKANLEQQQQMQQMKYSEQQQQSQQVHQQQQQQQQQHGKRPIAQYANRLMKRSLRPNAGLSTNSSNSINKKNSATSSISTISQPAKQAANIIWAPSNSLNTHKSNNSLTSNSSTEQLFTGFDSTENISLSLDEATLKPKTIPSGYCSPSPNSPYDSPDDEIVDQMIHLKLKQKHQIPPKDRSKAALQASAQVRFPQRPDTSHIRHNHRQHSNAGSKNSPARSYKTTANGTSSSYGHSSSPPVKIPVNVNRGFLDASDDDDTLDPSTDNDEALFKELKIDPGMGKQIINDMNSSDDEVRWTDIAGLDGAKQALMEAVVWPLLRPDLFTGLRQPPNGMLLFGPPGTGKTMLARAAATESESNFFSIQASSITSKFLGESEKLVKALFQIAKAKAPSIIFVDEIDSIMGQRSESGENDSMRRVKNEFLVQWSSLTKSAGRGQSSRVLVLAATNLPWAIDDAARRRFVKRQYIPLPEPETRRAQFLRLLDNAENNLSEQDLEDLVNLTDGYSGSDLDSLTKDAAMSTTRGLTWEQMMDKDLTVRPISLDDFKVSMKLIKPSVGKDGLAKFESWVKEFGSSGA